MIQVDESKLHNFIGKMLGDLGGAYSVPTVRLGFRLGLFDTLHDILNTEQSEGFIHTLLAQSLEEEGDLL